MDESLFEPAETRAKKGDILVAIRDSSTGEGIYREDDTTKGQEYECKDTYYCNGPCVFISSDSGYPMLGMSQDNFRIKKRKVVNKIKL